MRDRILWVNPSLPAGCDNCWKFLDQNASFTDNNDPWADGPLPECITLEPSGEVKFQAIKLGDLNCNAPVNCEIPVSPSSSMNIYFDDLTASTNDIIEIEFYSDNISDLQGYQLGINFNTSFLQFIEVVSSGIGETNEESYFGLSGKNSGKIRHLWLTTTTDGATEEGETEIFKLKFKALQNITTLASKITLLESDIPEEGWKGNGSKIGINFFLDDGFSRMGINNPGISTDLQTSQKVLSVSASPNPFSNFPSLNITTIEIGEVEIEILDNTGKLINKVSLQVNGGTHKFNLDFLNAQPKGVYNYKIVFKDQIQSGRLIKN